MRFSLLCFGLLLLACQNSSPAPSTQAAESRKPTAHPPQKATADTSSPAQPTPEGDRFRRLCLVADPGGKTAVDKRLQDRQQKAKVLPDKPNHWSDVALSWSEKARLHSDQTYYANVDACLTAALEIQPDFVPALEIRVLLLQNEHRFKEARAQAEAILKTAPNSPLTLGLLSDIYIELGEYELAINAAEKRAELQPGPDSIARSAYFSFLQGKTNEAVLRMREALATGRNVRAPESTAWAYCETADFLWHVNDPTADAVYAEALKYVPDYPRAIAGRGKSHLSQGKYKEAVTFLTKAMESAPSAPTAWLLGDAHTLAGNTEAAQKAYDEVARLGAEDRLTLALFYATRNEKLPEALKAIESELEQRNGIFIHDAHAWILYRMGRIPEAQAAAQKATALNTQDAALLFHAGAIFVAAGDTEAGQKLLQAAHTTNPNFDPLHGSKELAAILAQKP